MMIIRPATDDDLSAILQLSTVSLGGLGGLRSEEYWKWKHQQNPFGSSPVLLAFDQDKLVGLRAFMRWRFRYKGKSFLAYRAVDTATHPDHRGKGIFSKLTLQLVDQLQEGEPGVIFNTPNPKSMPGYVKMGWKEVGKTRLAVRVHFLNLLRNRMVSGSSDAVAPIIFPEGFQDTLEAWKTIFNDVVTTDYSMAYLRWRYCEVPGLSYGMKHVKTPSTEVLVIYRIKKSEKLTELRINELFITGGQSDKIVRSVIHELHDEHRPDVTTLLTDPKGILKRALPFGFIDASNRGLTITSRKVNSDALAELAGKQDEWYFSAGTLELF